MHHSQLMNLYVRMKKWAAALLIAHAACLWPAVSMRMEIPNSTAGLLCNTI
jgi:hypothetical protein